MRWAEGFIAVDWGTTNRRAYLIDGDGRCTGEFEDGRGALSVPKGEFPSAVQEIRRRLGDRPLLLAGMAGSNRGWIEAPYLSCPAGFADLAANLIRITEERAVIVPGVAVRSETQSDIMRGEEVQILGAAAAGTIPERCTICHPGTHNKWVRFGDGRIQHFRTVMTGEMFNLLRNGSILSDLLEKQAEADQSFRAGVRRGLDDTVLTAEIFSVRARVLLGTLERDEAASFASGLLIGADLRIGVEESADDEIIIMGRPALTALYSAALAQAGRNTVEIDGEGAFIAGARKLVELIE